MNGLMSAPPQVRWNYTYVCNFNCTHCYSRAAWYPKELPADAYKHIADQLIQAGVFIVGFGGGEALVRKDCLPIVQRLSRSGIHTVVTTNGWLLDERSAGRLADAGLGLLKVSLDSPVAEEHDAFRRRPGSFDRVMRALDVGIAAGLRVYLSTVLTAVNLQSMDAFAAIAERAGVEGVRFVPFRPAGNGVRTKSRYQLSADQREQIGVRLAQLRTSSGLDLSMTDDARCGCGVFHITIRPNGDVSPCNFAEGVVGNVMRDSLLTIWRTAPALQAWREAGGCTPAADQPAPSNPGAASTPEPVVFVGAT
jgi:AdoMet-dependent heme synthase